MDNITREYDVAIVGGGVSGMFSALRLSENGKKVGLFEMSDRWGGRIETVMMGDKKFKAEFGPMRYEKKGQELLQNLLNELGLSTSPFPPYQSSMPRLPDYRLDNAEERRWESDPLSLLRMGILKVLGVYRNGMTLAHINKVIDGYTEASYPRLRETARQGGRPGGKPLYSRGFWNALGDEMSHRAVMKIRDVGNFYHLIPENPNAIEWIIFWLRGLQPNDYLVGIKGGSKGVTEKLLDKLEQQKNVHLVTCAKLTNMVSEGALTRLEFSGSLEVIKAKDVILALPKSPLLKLSKFFSEQTVKDLNAVIAFPLLKCFFVTDKPWWDENTKPQTGADTMPTRELHYYQEHKFQLSEEQAETYRRELDAGMVSDLMRAEFKNSGIDLVLRIQVTPLPLNKGWIIYDPNNLRRQNYFIQREDLSVFDKNGWGMVMLYTDRPATEYWNDYIINKENHDRAEMREDKRLVDRFMKYLSAALKTHIDNLKCTTSCLDKEFSDPAQEFLELSREQIQEKLEERIQDFGIRDWGLQPYGAGCHVWRPNAKSWEVIKRLNAFDLIDDHNRKKSIHICGESHSDYQGFIEGALLTANGVIESISGKQ